MLPVSASAPTHPHAHADPHLLSLRLSQPSSPSSPAVCHFAQGVGDKVYDRVTTFTDLSNLLNGALDEYNETNAAMNLVLFEDAMRHVCRISRIIEGSGGHALMVGVGGMGKQSLARLATFVNGYSAFQVRGFVGCKGWGGNVHATCDAVHGLTVLSISSAVRHKVANLLGVPAASLVLR